MCGQTKTDSIYYTKQKKKKTFQIIKIVVFCVCFSKGIAWRDDPHIFLSVSKDFTLYQHVFRDAVRPADSAAPIGLAVNIHGDITHAVSDKLGNTSTVKGSDNYQSTKVPSFFR